MDKLTLAHDAALAMINNGCSLHTAIADAWAYADAMQAEADKRISKERPKVLFEPKCEVDWRVAPTWAKYWAARDGSSALWCVSEPTCTDDCLMSSGACSPAPSFGFTGNHIVERPHGL